MVKRDNRTDKEKEIDRLKFVLEDLTKNGLRAYEEHRDLILKMCKKKIFEEIKLLENKNESKY